MKLKEFDFYSDRDRSLTNRLRNETRFLCALYSRCFDELATTDDIWKLEVKLVASDPESEIRLLDGVAVVELQYEVERLLAITPQFEKNRKLLELLQKAAERACDAFSWPKGPFVRAKQGVIDRNFTNEWIWKKSKWSPNKERHAEILCQHEPHVFRMHLQVRDREGRVTELKVLEVPPDEFLFSRYFGELRWITHNELRWTTDDGEILWAGETGQPAY